MSEASAKRRGPLVRAIVAVVILLLIGGSIVLGLTLTRERIDLRPQSEVVLRQIGDGKAVDVYAQATARFQELMLEERFVEMTETMNQTLGRFVKTLDVLDSQSFDGASGRTARVVLSLQFDNTKTTGDFSFLKVGKKWKLLGMRVSVPDKLVEAVDALERDPSRTKAPKAVITMVRDIGRSLEKRELDPIYRMMSPPFRQSVSRADLDELIGARTRTFGPFQRMLDILSSAQNRKKDRAQVSAVFQFEKARTTVHFAFIKSESGEWLLSGLKIPHPGQ